VPKLKVELFVAADQVDPAIETILKAARSGAIGDGKILTSPIESILRIRTGEKDLDAL
jgi:nitrogen regulatory protein P-II 1